MQYEAKVGSSNRINYTSLKKNKYLWNKMLKNLSE